MTSVHTSICGRLTWGSLALINLHVVRTKTSPDSLEPGSVGFPYNTFSLSSSRESGDAATVYPGMQARSIHVERNCHVFTDGCADEAEEIMSLTISFPLLIN